MTQYLKKLAAVSPDALETALRVCPLSKETREQLKALSEIVVKASPTKTAKRTPGDDFLKYIVPKIEKAVKEYQEKKRGFRLPDLKLELPDFINTDLENLVTVHEQLMQQELSLSTRLLYIRFQRGLLYKEAHKHMTDLEQFRNWLKEKFELSYSSVTAYIHVAELLKRYPMLFVCGLTFEQIRRHSTRIRSFCESCSDFSMDEPCDISDDVDVVSITAEPSEIKVPDMAPKDPDFEFFTDAEKTEDDFPFFDDMCEGTF